MRTFAVALVLASVAIAAPAFADVPAPVGVGMGAGAVPLVWSPALIAKVKTQIGIDEARAAALQPILARDIASRDSLQADATALDNIAKEEDKQAAEFKAMAELATEKKQRQEFNQFSNEMEGFSKRSEESAKNNREAARALNEPIRHMQAQIARHLARAAALKTALANNS